MKKKLAVLFAALSLAASIGLAGCGGEKNVTITFRGDQEYTVTVSAGAAITLPDPPQKTGYTFGGWFTDVQCTKPFDASKGSETDLEVWAKFTANTDTPYAVEYYLEGADGAFAKAEAMTERKTGETDSSVTADAKEIEHYIFDAENTQNVVRGKIAADGSLILRLYYRRIRYVTITFHGLEDRSVKAVAGAAITLPDPPQKAGYTFGGWFTDVQCTKPFDASKGSETDLEVWAKFTVNTDTPYAVEYYLEGADGAFAKAEAMTERKTGETDSSVTADVKEIEHYIFDAENTQNIVRGEIAADGSLILRLYYTRKTYTVTFKNGDVVLGDPLLLKYGTMPVYTGASPERSADANVYLFRDFGEIIPVCADAVYTARYFEIKNYGGYRFLESFMLPDVSSVFAGVQVKHYLDESEVAADALQKANIGLHTWKIAVIKDAEIFSQVSLQIGVVAAAEYYAQYGSGDTDQFTERFAVDTASGVTFMFEALDEKTYGVPSAYRYTALDGSVTADHKWIELKNTNGGDVKAGEYTALSFDVWVIGGNPSFPYVIFGDGQNAIYQTKFQITEKLTGALVENSAFQTGKWYTVRVEVPVAMIDSESVHMVFADNKETADLYIRNVFFSKLETANDYIAHSIGDGATIAYDASEVFGKTGTYKYVSTKGAWDSRVQFSESAMNEWNVQAEKVGVKFVFDVCFAEGVSDLYFNPIVPKGVTLPMNGIYLSNKEYVTIKNADGTIEGNIVSGVWYTVEIPIDGIGRIEKSGGDVGLQLAANVNSGGTFWFDNCRFENIDIANVFTASANVTFVYESADVYGRTGTYKYVSTKGAWDSRMQFTNGALGAYTALQTSGGGKFAFDVCTAGDFNLQFWYIAAEGAMKDFTSSSAPIAVWKDALGKTVAPENIEQNVWYTLEIDANVLGALTQSGTDVGLQIAANSETGGTFYLDNVRFVTA